MQPSLKREQDQPKVGLKTKIDLSKNEVFELSSYNNMSKISSSLPMGAQVVPNLEAYSRTMIENKNCDASISLLAGKIAMKQQYDQKMRTETWLRALTELGKFVGISGLSLDQIFKKFPILQENSVQAIKKGEFKLKKVPDILLEVLSVEQVGNCYQVTCADIQFGFVPKEETVIQVTFHSDCKSLMQKKVRKGKIVHLKNAAVYSLGMQASMSNLVVMAECVANVIR